MRECEPTVVRKDREKARVYRCKQEDCGKVFSDQPSLKKHMITHGERMVSYFITKDILSIIIRTEIEILTHISAGNFIKLSIHKIEFFLSLLFQIIKLKLVHLSL